jgi:hypothetical protein
MAVFDLDFFDRVEKKRELGGRSFEVWRFAWEFSGFEEVLEALEL